MKRQFSSTVATSSVRPVLPRGLTESRHVPFAGQRLWMTRRGEMARQRILPSSIDVAVSNLGELQCNVSSVNIWTHSHWEFVSKKKN